MRGTLPELGSPSDGGDLRPVFRVPRSEGSAVIPLRLWALTLLLFADPRG